MVFEPIFWKTLDDSPGVFWPGRWRAQIDEPRAAGVVVLISEVPRREHADASRGVLDTQEDAVVFLPALSAKHQRQKHTLTITRHELLTVDRDVARSLGLG